MKKIKVSDNDFKEIGSLFKEILNSDSKEIKNRIASINTKLLGIKSILLSFKKAIEINNDLPNKYNILNSCCEVIDMIEEDCKKYGKLTSSDDLDKFKECPSVKYIMVVLGSLKDYEKYFKDINDFKTLKTSWEPFSRIKFNIMLIKDSDKDLMVHLRVINLIYKLSSELYKDINTPTIDLEKLKDLIKLFLEKEKKRCGDKKKELFNLLESSIDIFNDKIPDYYRQSTVSGSYGTIIELFFKDVVENTIDMEYNSEVGNRKSKMRVVKLVSQLKLYLDEMYERSRQSAMSKGDKDALKTINKMHQYTEEYKNKLTEKVSKLYEKK